MTNIKSEILDRIIEAVNTQIQNAERGRLSAIEDSKAHKGAMESRFDTFKEEAQALAGALNTQVTELGKMLFALKSVRDYCLPTTKVAGCALVAVESCDDGSRTKYFLLPAGGGNEYEMEGEKITVLSVGAPLARAFMGAVAGQEVEVKIQGVIKRFKVVLVT